MAIERVYWNDGVAHGNVAIPLDHHVLWGKPSNLNLKDRFSFFYKKPPIVAQNQEYHVGLLHHYNNEYPAEVATLKFEPMFKLGPSGAGVHSGFGITVNATDGTFTTGAKPSGHSPRNFCIEAEVTQNTFLKRLYHRFHLHEYVAHAWLSPNPLDVIIGCTGLRMAVYAQFDDKVIADISHLPGIVWASVPAGKVNAQGEFTLSPSDKDTAITIQATLPVASLHGHANVAVVATGMIYPYIATDKKQGDPTDKRQVELLPGSAGYDRRHEVVNVLFLADGFKAEDETKFDSILLNFLRTLRQHRFFRPFNLLVPNMNFWKFFVPSRERGLSNRNDVIDNNPAIRVLPITMAFEVENTHPNAMTELRNGEWDQEQMFFYFGLPVLEQTTWTNAQVIDYWQAISRVPQEIIELGEFKIPHQFVEFWKTFGERRLPNLRDTFLGHKLGEPMPVFDGDRGISSYSIHEGRMEREKGLNDLLKTLNVADALPSNGILGSVWDMSAAPKPGKDYDYVVVLLCGEAGRAINRPGTMLVNVNPARTAKWKLEPDAIANAGYADGRAVKWTELGPEAVPEMIGIDAFSHRELVHELCHSFGLGDEYGELGIGLESPYLNTTNVETPMAGGELHNSNTQYRTSLLTAGKLDGKKVKWRWHRIEKVGVIMGIAEQSGQYIVSLGPGQGKAFEVGDPVFLRRRVLGESLVYDVDPLQKIATNFPAITRSPQLTVQTKNDDFIIVTVAVPSTLAGCDLVATFPAGCVVYKPLPIRTDDVNAIGYPWLELPGTNVLQLITDTGKALHEKVGNAGELLLDMSASQSPDLGPIELPICQNRRNSVVGLYAGGDKYHHGVYHATGHCLMRGQQMVELCPVCQYILTDYIDPMQHVAVDSYIQEYYPM